jgi:hypothetical protein
MTCNEIENRLPAYVEEIISPEERKSIMGHLASCPRCSRAFVDLKKAEELVQSLGEVEPPPFFERRIMSLVREEAGQKQGILRRVFYPLHIKVPIQVLVTLLVAVLAFHVYQQGEPETKQMAPLPIPLTELGKGQLTAKSPQTSAPSSDVTAVTRAPAGDHPDNDQRFVVPPSEKGGKEERRADSQAPIRAAMKTADAVMAMREEEVPPVSAEALTETKDGAGKQHAGKALETLLPELERKEKMTDTVAAAEENRKTMSAPSPSGMTAVADIKRQVIDLTIQVRDMDVAIREIETRLGQVKARIIEKKHHQGSEFLQAEIAAPNVAALLGILGTVGKVTREANPPDLPDGNVILNIKIVSHP